MKKLVDWGLVRAHISPLLFIASLAVLALMTFGGLAHYIYTKLDQSSWCEQTCQSLKVDYCGDDFAVCQTEIKVHWREQH